jgi:hypothetical protein
MKNQRPFDLPRLPNLAGAENRPLPKRLGIASPAE